MNKVQTLGILGFMFIQQCFATPLKVKELSKGGLILIDSESHKIMVTRTGDNIYIRRCQDDSNDKSCIKIEDSKDLKLSLLYFKYLFQRGVIHLSKDLNDYSDEQKDILKKSIIEDNEIEENRDNLRASQSALKFYKNQMSEFGLTEEDVDMGPILDVINNIEKFESDCKTYEGFEKARTKIQSILNEFLNKSNSKSATKIYEYSKDKQTLDYHLLNYIIKNSLFSDAKDPISGKTGMKDALTGRIWFFETKSNLNLEEAKTFCESQNQVLPTIEDWALADSHHIQGAFFRKFAQFESLNYWSSSIHKTYSYWIELFRVPYGDRDQADIQKKYPDIFARCISKNP